MNSNPILKSLPCALIAAAALLALELTPARGANGNPPELISYQGYLVDAEGSVLGGTNTGPRNYDVIFRICNDQVLNGAANRIWSEQQTITVDKGYFSVMLGQGAAYAAEPRPLLSTLFTNAVDASDRYIEITVKGIGTGGGDSTILPRMRLLSSPYALAARHAVVAAALASGGVSIVTMSGTNVGINKSSPTSALDVAGTIASTGLAVSGPASISGATTLSAVTASTITAASLTVTGSISGFGTVPIGAILMWSGATVPAGWTLCDGSTVNGQVTPDLRGRFVLGQGTGSGLTARSLKAVGGAETHTLTTNEIPSHVHPVDPPNTSTSNDPHRHPIYGSYGSGFGGATGPTEDAGLLNGDGYGYSTVTGSDSHSHSVNIPAFASGSAGGGGAHNNMPPFYVLAYIMRTQ